MRAEVLSYWEQMLPYMLVVLPLIIAARILINVRRHGRGEKFNIVHELGVIVFLLYLVGLLSQALLMNFAFEGVLRINLIPLNKLTEIQTAIATGNLSYVLIEVIGNIGLFAIIGFMLPLLWRKCESLWNTLMWCFILSLFIELAQLFLPRATDVDDLIMNTLGGLLGYILYRLLRTLMPRVMEKFKSTKKEAISDC